MESVNDNVRELEIRHQVYLQRLSSGVLKRLIAILDAADAEIVGKLRSRGATLEGSFTSVRLAQLLQALAEINRQAHAVVGGELRGELNAIVAYEAGFQRDLIAASIPVRVDLVTPSAETLRAAVTAQPFQGRLLKEWVSELSDAKSRRLRDAIRLGVVQGETTDQIVRRVRGTKALNYRDGVMEIGRRGAEAMVRTAVSHTTGVAQESLYKANSDIIAKVQWSSTLDTRTCKSCMALDGKTFAIEKAPKRPLHIGCRCVVTPVIKSWREMGFDFDEIPAGTRVSMNGQVSATETYGTWLRKQSAETQDEALGPTRALLFRKGGLDVDRFTNRAGDDIDLGTLRKMDAEAFRRAGLAA